MTSSELTEYRNQLNLIQQELNDNPNDESLLEIQQELILLIKELEQDDTETIKSSTSKPDSPDEQVTVDEKSNKTINSDTEKGRLNEKQTLITDKHESSFIKPSQNQHHVGKTVLAMTPNKTFMPAKIALIAGSASDRSYTVKFLKSGLVSTLKEYQINEQSHTKMNSLKIKRKSESCNNGNTPSKAQKLSESQNKWQQFNQKMTKKKKKTTLG